MCFARPSGARPRSGTSRRLTRQSRLGSAKSPGSSHIPTPISRARPTRHLGPEARYEQTEAISLAFVTALQALPARQRAVLILREVLGYHATEVAEMLDSTLESVNSALKRARATLQRRLPPRGENASPPAPDSPAEQALVAKFVRAYESGDVDALVTLLTADVSVSMPPVPLEYQGRDVVARFFASVFRERGMYHLVPTRANGQLAFGAYLRTPTGAPPRGRPARPHRRRRSHFRPDPLRQRRAAVIRAAAIASRLTIIAYLRQARCRSLALGSAVLD